MQFKQAKLKAVSGSIENKRFILYFSSAGNVEPLSASRASVQAAVPPEHK